jgi:mRNA-degrading endonuclease RelE of RelBE toxin-antitoxin system
VNPVVLVFEDRAGKDLRRIPQAEREKIISALERLANTGQGDVCRLKGNTRFHRLRTGDYRSVFEYATFQEHRCLIVKHVGHRKEVYR